MKILFFLLLFVAIVVAAAFAFPTKSPDQQLKLLKDVVFGALQVFSIVMAIAATALLLPRDVEDRTLYTILSKPVPRHEYLIGKLLGVLLLIGGGLLFMDIVFCGVLWLKQSLITAAGIEALKAEQNDTPENIAAISAAVARQGLTWSLHAGVWCVFLKASVVASLALLMSCIASSTLFTILVSFCFTIAGQGQGLLRSFVLKGLPVTWKKICAFVLAVLVPDLGLFDQVQAVIEGRSDPAGDAGAEHRIRDGLHRPLHRRGASRFLGEGTVKLNRKAAAVVLLAVAGVVKLPLEERFSEKLRAKGLLQAPVGLDTAREPRADGLRGVARRIALAGGQHHLPAGLRRVRGHGLGEGGFADDRHHAAAAARGLVLG